MHSKKKVFSDSWDRVADRHAALLPGVVSHSEFYRGESWRVLRAPYENEFFRLTEEAWGFVARLSMDLTINEAWRQAMESDPEGAPGQEEVIEILGQLSSAGLILSDIAADSRQILRSKREEKRKMVGKQALNFLFLRIPIFNPDRLLTIIRPLGGFLMHPIAFITWLCVVGWGLKTVVENWDEVRSQSAGFLAPDNLFLVLIATIVLKLLHELGHGIACKRFGGYVPTFGIMFVLFAPMPFVDATASWGFRDRWRRICGSSAGMYVEVFVAAIATIVWANVGDGNVKGLAHNVMLIGSITTLLFNLNPLLKFDGYYLLVDLLSLPNLQQRSVKYLQYVLERYGFGRDEADSPADHPSEAVWLGLYGVCAGLYRVFLMLSIAMIVGQQFFELGVALALFTLVLYILMPVLKFFRYVLTARELVFCRTRALLLVGSVVSVLVIGLGFVPVAEYFQEPGIVRPTHQLDITARFEGRMLEEPRATGQWVERGSVLFTLINSDHEYDIEIAKASVARLKLRLQIAQREAPVAVASLRRLLDIENSRLERLLKQRSDLIVTAPISGYWVGVGLDNRKGAWFKKGQVVGQIRATDDFEFLAIVSQQRAADSFLRGEPTAVGVRLWGQGDQTIPLENVYVVPGGQTQLPSAALGWMGGGDVKVKQDDPDGTRTEERFYLLRGTLRSTDGSELSPFMSDRTGEVRIRLEDRALALQLWDIGRRAIQQRLKI